jgi:mannitol-1-phosphate 5-dehydrogenase
VGAALNALKQGVTPVHLVTGIAAGLRFAHPDDPVAQEIQAQLRERGIEHVLTEVCGLAPDEPLTEMVVQRYQAIKSGR